jgi:hypothetical protein
MFHNTIYKFYCSFKLQDHFYKNTLMKYHFISELMSSVYVCTQTKTLDINGCQLHKHATQIPNSSHADIHNTFRLYIYDTQLGI